MQKPPASHAVDRWTFDAPDGRSRPSARRYLRAPDLLDAAFPHRSPAADALAEQHIVLDGYGRILGISPSVAARFGSSAPKLVGRRLVHRVLGAHRPRLLQALLSLRTTLSFEPELLRFHRKNGSDIDVRLEQVARVDGPRGTVIVVCAPRFVIDGALEAAPVREPRAHGNLSMSF